MAVGIEQIAGPVNAGDIIMRDEEAPRGAAALLNKMINKGTQGMYKLPEQDKEMPGFMKDAIKESEQAAVDPSDFRTILRILEAGGNPEDYMEQTKLDASDFRTILKLLEQGFSMEEIESMTQAKMTKDGPKEGLSMKDIVNLDQAAVQGGKINFLGEQPEVKAPIRAQSHADSPPTELAYITDAEKDLLVRATLLGSMDGKPNEGPSGIHSLDDFFMTPGGGISGGSTADAREPDRPDRPVLGGGGGGTSAEDYGIQPGMAVGGGDQGTGGQVFVSPQSAGAGETQVNAFIPVSDAQQERLEALADANRAKTLANLGIQTADSSIIDIMKAGGGAVPLLAMKGADALAEGIEAFERKQVEDLFSGDVDDVGFGMGSLMRALEKDPDRADEYFDKYEDEINRAMGSGEKTAGGDSIGGLEGTAQEKINAIVQKFSGNKNFDKNYQPEKFYKTEKGESQADFQKRMREKGVDSKELAEAQAFGKIGFTRQNTQMIEEGRRRLERERRGSDTNRGGSGGGGGTTPADTTPDTTPDPDPRAGQFNVGGTMPYTDDRTGNVEKMVPLGRRFQLTEEGKFRDSTPFTMSDVMKYATKGGFQQLEPFQEYLKRRKDFLGEEDPEYFDEEGNVIYGGPQ